jgi:hypothetical protein
LPKGRCRKYGGRGKAEYDCRSFIRHSFLAMLSSAEALAKSRQPFA